MLSATVFRFFCHLLLATLLVINVALQIMCCMLLPFIIVSIGAATKQNRVQTAAKSNGRKIIDAPLLTLQDLRTLQEPGKGKSLQIPHTPDTTFFSTTLPTDTTEPYVPKLPDARTVTFLLPSP